MDVPRDLPLLGAPPRLYRVHLGIADGTQLAPWEYAHVQAAGGNTNFGGRFDDPNPVPGERFRTLSLGSDPVGVAMEVYQSLRPDPAFLALAAGVNFGRDVEPNDRPVVNVSEITKRSMSSIILSGQASFAPILESHWRAYLEKELRPQLTFEGMKSLKTGELMSARVDLSQRVAELIHDRFPSIAGITMPSTLGSNYMNYFVFEKTPERGDLRADSLILDTHVLSLSSPEIQNALDLLDLDVALDKDESLKIRPIAYGLDTSSLPVYDRDPRESLSYREDYAKSFINQEMTVLGRSEDGTRILGRNGGELLSVSRGAFESVPAVDDLIALSTFEGVDRAVVTGHQLAMEFSR